MAISTARRLDPAHATPFADAALELRGCALAVLPLGKKSGKDALVNYANWKVPPGPEFLKKEMVKHPTANVGILTGLSRLTVVDIDEPYLLDEMLERFGDTPLIIGTPRGGFHLYYHSTGELNRQRLDGLKVDIRGVGGMIVVPPSICQDSNKAHLGKPYTFVRGTWRDLTRLPAIKSDALPVRAKVYEGTRNISLFCHLMYQVRACDTFEALMDVAETFNLDCEPKLSEARLATTAQWVWKKEQAGENWLGGAAQVSLEARSVIRMAWEHPLHGPVALMLYFVLREAHGARSARGEDFAVCADAMTGKSLPWSAYRIREATRTLLKAGYLRRVKRGGRGPGDTSKYLLCSPAEIRGRYST